MSTLQRARALTITILTAALAVLAPMPAGLASVAVPASSTVVISEFRVRGPVGGSDEFVELFNLSGGPVNIGGWTLRGSNSSGTASIRATVAAGTILPAGCHFLFTNSSASGGPYSGTVPGNQTFATGVTDDGGIAIAAADATIVDQVGLSTGSLYKEGTPLAPLGSTNANRSYERLPGGTAGSAIDTDDNSADFQLITPSDPQNLASTCVSAGNPSGVGAALPNPVQQGSTSLLTVAVTPGAPPQPITSVTGNLTAISGSSAQPFFDDGTHGDATAGDQTFSFLTTVPASVTAGTKALSIAIVDAAMRSGATSISLIVTLPPPQFVAIHDIQGAGLASPYVGQPVLTRGVVTARRFNNGFFIQTPDADADADPLTSQGIFVFTSSAPPATAAVGNLVEVSGLVQEFIPSSAPTSRPITEITLPIVSLVSTSAPLPLAMTLTPPDLTSAGTVDQLERYEHMRVRVDALTVVSATGGNVSEANATSTSNGEFFAVFSSYSRPFREAGIAVTDPLPAGAPSGIPRFDTNPERIRVDSDGQIGAVRVDVPVGALVAGVVGVLDYGARIYTILPDPATPPTASGTLAAVAVPMPGAREFTVGSANLERFFDTTDAPSVGDAVLTPAAFNNRLAKASLQIRQVMRSPDLIGLVEIENLPTLQALAQRVNDDAVAAGDPNPIYVAYLEEGNDPGGIDVGVLVKSSRVSVVDVAQFGKTDTYTDPNTGLQALLNDRPPLVVRAIVGGPGEVPAPVTLIVNHLRSLTDVDDPADGGRVRAKRRAQAEWLASLIQARQALDPTERIIAVGDFNAFEFSDGYVDVIGTLIGTPAPPDQVVLASADLVTPDLVNLVALAAPAERYSFVFEGSAQSLDHVLVTANILPMFTRLAWGRSNADFPEVLRADATRPERVSDHDSLVAYFQIVGETATTVVALPNPATLGQPVTFTATVSTSGSPVTTGSITFTDGATVLGTSAVSAAGQASLTTASLAVGPHEITATFSGAPDLGASTGTTTLTVVPPVPVPVDDEAHTLEGQAVAIAVLDNDSSAGGGALTVTGVTTPAHGTAAVGAAGVITYTPEPGFFGTDTFGYTVTNSFGAAAPAVVTVHVSRIGRFVALSLDHTRLLAGSRVWSGDVGAIGPLLGHAHPREIGSPAFANATMRAGVLAAMAQPGSRLVGDRVRLDPGSSAFDVVFNTLSNAGTIRGASVSPMIAPFVALPAFPEVTPGTANVDVPARQSRVLGPGAYGTIRVRAGATLILTGGRYDAIALDVDGLGKVIVRGATDLRIAREVATGAGSRLMPDPDVAGLTAASFVIFVEGRDAVCTHAGADADGDDAGPTAVHFGPVSIVHANVYAPNGTVWIRSAAQGRGAFIGMHVRVGALVQLRLESGFR